MSHLNLIKKYYHLVETFQTDIKQYADILHPQIIPVEFPNLLNKKVREGNLESMNQGMVAGKNLLSAQHFEITNGFETENQAVVECIWTGTIAADKGPFKKDQVLKAYICAVFEFKDNKIFRQRNYDCYEEF